MKKNLTIIFLLLVSATVFPQRIKDIAYFKGVGSEQLIGYGLVVGLGGTGDSYRSNFTVQSVTSMLKRFGITVPESNLRTRNVAAVMVTSRVSNLLKAGAAFDINVSSMGDATSLAGGTLLMTPLSGPTGDVYASAQGPVSVGGFDINTSSGGRSARNLTSAGRVPSGGTLEAELPRARTDSSLVSIFLRDPDFTTSNNIATAINKKFGSTVALSMGAGEVNVKVPEAEKKDFASFLARVEVLDVQKDVEARVVLNERTGTVVAGSSVRISPATVSQGGLNISIKSYQMVSQPAPFTQGTTQVLNNQVPQVSQESPSSIAITGASTVQQVASALNSLKVSPRDIIAIFQALKQAGALSAELIII